MPARPQRGLERLLGPLEGNVMLVLWGHQGELTVHEVLEGLNEDRIEPYAYSTVVTVMTRLARKGLLQRRRVGKAHAYWPTMDPEEFVRSRAGRAARSMMAEFGDLALAGFVDEVRSDPEQLRKLKELLDRGGD